MLLLRLKTYFTFFLPSPINQYFSFKECSIFCTSVRRASACHCRHCHFGFDWRTDGRSKCLATTSIQLLRLVSFKNWAPPPHPTPFILFKASIQALTLQFQRDPTCLHRLVIYVIILVLTSRFWLWETGAQKLPSTMLEYFLFPSKRHCSSNEA